MMIAISLTRLSSEVLKRRYSPTFCRRSASSGLRSQALNGPRRPPRGPDMMSSATLRCAEDISVASLAPAGRLVTCGATTGYDAKVDLRFLFSRQLSLLGSYMGTKGELHRVMKLVAGGKLKPVVDRVFPLAEAAAAHAYLESSSQFGKVVLSI